MCVWLTQSLNFMLQLKIPYRKLFSLQFNPAAPQFSVIPAAKMRTHECLYLRGERDSDVLSIHSAFHPSGYLIIGGVSRKAPSEKPKMY